MRAANSVWDQRVGRWLRIYIPVVILIVVTLFPFYWMAVTSFKSIPELLDVDKSPLMVSRPTLEWYRHLFMQTSYPRWMLNTIVVATVATAVSLGCSILAAYSLARLRYRGAATIAWSIFVTYLVPPALLFLPLTALIASLHLINNLLALMLTYPTFQIPFCTWLLMAYFRGIPRELEEAALVDGANRVQVIVRIVLPLALPGIVSAGIFAFTLSWNEFLYSLMFMSDSDAKTIPVGVVQELRHGELIVYPELMAAALVGSMPVVLLYSFFVESFVKGMTAGVVKG